MKSDNPDIFKMIINESILGIATFNKATGHCEYANPLANELLEIPAATELNEINYGDFFLPDQGEYKGLGDSIVSFAGYYQDVLVKKHNGMRFIANVGVRHIDVDGDEMVLLMIQDVTLKKKLQKEVLLKQKEIASAYEELLAQNKQLKDLDVAKNRFIAMTTHELRTPLSAMVGSAELLKDKFYETDEEHDEFVSMIFDQGQHLMELVNDILDFSKIQNGKMDFFVSQRDLAPLIQSEMDSLESMAAQSEVTMTFVDETKQGEYLCWYDDLRVKQVIANTLSNAIKYNRKGGTVEVKICEKDDDVYVYVKDSGKGIPEEQLQQVFNEFETLGKVSNHQKGTGLGMPITRKLLIGMGGNIDLSSEVGVGSTFWFHLPKNKVLDDEHYRERMDDLDLAI